MVIGEVFLHFLISVNFAVCTDTANQYYPAAIFANNLYYAFWSDYRYYNSSGLYSIFGARITNTGIVLDPGGRALYSNQSAHEPKVAFDGNNFLVVFRDSC